MSKTKYILINWPDYQLFMDHPRFKDDCYNCLEVNAYFIPEDLYEEVTNPPYELPEEYKEVYDINFKSVKKGQNLLVLPYDTEEVRIIKSKTNWKINYPFPILLEDDTLLEGINCVVVAAEKI